MKKSNLVIVGIVIAINFVAWAYINRPHDAPAWTGTIRGVSFSPFQKGDDPFANKYPSAQAIENDLQLLEGKVSRVRTYSSTNGMEAIPQLAQKHNLRVTAGAWLDRDHERNEREIENLIKNVRAYDSVERVIVGNEALLREDLTVEELTQYLRRVREASHVPVSAAEPWTIWLKHPELAAEVDYIAIHILPYWEGVPAEVAANWSLEIYNQLKAAFPDKPVVIGEVGWPSAGNRIKDATASLVNQARFTREFLNLAALKQLDYFIVEAFDQPWKRDSEGAVGMHWGLFNVDRTPKYPMVGAVTENKLWSLECGFSILFSLIPTIMFLRYWHNLRKVGQVFFAGLLQLVASTLVWTLFIPFTEWLTPSGMVIWAVLLPAQIALFVVILTNGLEMTEILWIKVWRRKFQPLAHKPSHKLPKVSIHLAIHNEPPDMVKETLDGLAALDYPDYEVLIIDNNTSNEEMWKPVQEYCKELGARFRFYHLPKWPGYKAGALNFALKETHPDAQVVGVIDSDYVVRPDWLKAVVPYFEKESVGFVQAPQDNREWRGDAFKTMINWEYNGFFQIGMVHRNERNAIIQHGTMTLVRRDAFEKVGHWGEWCICEDSELGLRLFNAGYEGVYVNESFGVGITPTSFAGYKGQRFRWTFGAIQILRGHWRKLMPFSKSGLTTAQKFHFVTGWLPWFTDAMHLVFTLAGIVWTAGMVIRPDLFEFPLSVFLIPTLGMFLFKIMHAQVLYRSKVACNFWQSVGASIAGMGLTHSIARAVFTGLFSASKPFLRTPKGENKPAFVKGLLMAWEELQIFSLIWIMVVANFWRFGTHHHEARLWGALLAVQSLPYLAAMLTSLASTLPQFHIALAGMGQRALGRVWISRKRRDAAQVKS